MAAKEKYPGLDHMFGTYFHQDWDLEGDDWPDLVWNYSHNRSPEDLKAAADEIDRLLAEGNSEAEIEERLLREFGCYYYAHPDSGGPGFVAWLGQVAGLLRSAALKA